MSSILIRDLARIEPLDRPTMAAVRGGWKVGPPAPSPAAAAAGPACAEGAHVDDTLPQRGEKTIKRR